MPTRIFGSLELVDHSGRQYWELRGPQPAMMTMRVITDSFSREAGTVLVPDNVRNWELLEWIMIMYPLEIKSKDQWYQRIGKTHDIRVRRKSIMTLSEATVGGQFLGNLFDYQKKGLDFLLKTDGNALIADEMGLGKAQPLDAKILTPTGWILMGQARVGDEIINSNGSISHITGVYPQGNKDVYRVTFSDKSCAECCDDHLWEVNSPLRKWRGYIPKVLPLKKIRARLVDATGNKQHFIRLVRPIQFGKKFLPLHPYLLGVLLGDGSISCSHITPCLSSADNELLERVRSLLPAGMWISKIKNEKYDYRLSDKTGYKRHNRVAEALKQLNLKGVYSETKFIPLEYKLASVEDRIALLQGLLDTDGYAGAVIEFSSVSKVLALDVVELVQSLGGIARLKPKKTSWVYKGIKKLGLAYRVTISLPPEIKPFALSRKANAYRKPTKYFPTRAIASVDFIGQKQCQCIATDAIDKLYVTNDYVLTHNTWEALAYLVTAQDTFPVLIVAPLVTLTNWQREIATLIRRPDGQPFKVNVIRSGNPYDAPSQMKLLETDNRLADIFLINYDLVARRRDDLEEIAFKSMLADEAHNLRGLETQRTIAVKEIANIPSIKHRIALSGTPCYNHGTEIWSIIDFVYPGLLGTHAEFGKEFIDGDGTIEVDKRQALLEILNQNVMIRRRKIDVLDLPPKMRYRQVIQIDAELYEHKMRAILKEFREKMADAKNKTNFKELSQHIYTSFRTAERVTAGLAKVPFVVKFVEQMMENDEPVVVFCHHHDIRDTISSQLWQYNPVNIVGGQSDYERQDAIDKFQNGESKLMIASLRCANVGISLTAASYVIFAELDFTPAVHYQAEDRLHRIHQKHTVFAYYLEGAGTYDERIAEILVTKKLEIDEVLGDTQRSDEGSGDDGYVEKVSLSAETRKLVDLMTERFSKVDQEVRGEAKPLVSEEDTDSNIANRNRLGLVLSALMAMEATVGFATRDNLVSTLETKCPMSRSESNRLISQLMREGTIYEPRENCFKKT